MEPLYHEQGPGEETGSVAARVALDPRMELELVWQLPRGSRLLTGTLKPLGRGRENCVRST